MNGPRRARAPEPNASPTASGVTPERGDVPATEQASTAAGGARDAAPDFVWPPPDAEIDALEIVTLTTPAEGPPVVGRIATAPIKAAPGGRLVASDLERLAQLARGEELSAARPRFLARFKREHVGVITLIVLLVTAAFAAGVYLGVKHGRADTRGVDERVAEASSSSGTPRTAVPPAAAPRSSERLARSVSSASSPAPAEAARRSASRQADVRPGPEQAAAARSRQPSPLSSGTGSSATANATAPVRSTVPGSTAEDKRAGAAARDIESRAAGAASPSLSSSSYPTPAPAEGFAAPTAGADAAIAAVPEAPSAARRAESSGVIAAAADIAQIRKTVERFEDAYEALDAQAARRVWPSLPLEQLSRAFGALKSQSMNFERCAVNRLTEGSAKVACAGSTAVVPRIGHGTPVVEARHWEFVLQRTDEGWLIASVDVARP